MMKFKYYKMTENIKIFTMPVFCDSMNKQKGNAMRNNFRLIILKYK